MYHQLQKVLNLAKKTGDRLILFDPHKPDNSYAIIPIDEYEKIAIGRNEVRGLTEDELLDKINRDIAIWKSEQDLDDFSENKPVHSYSFPDFKSKPQNNLFNEDFNSIIDVPEKNDIYSRQEMSEPASIKNILKKDKKAVKKHWSIPQSRKESAEEIIEEDRQYLEDIAY